MLRIAKPCALLALGFLVTYLAATWARRPAPVPPAVAPGTPPDGRPGAGPAPPGMAWVPGGEFTMGSDDPEAAPAEHPAHRARVAGFWMDVTEVTNAQFRTFVEATGYATTAERPIDWEQLRRQLPPGTPKPPDDRLAPGSLVFSPPSHPVPLDDPSAWWRWVPGASWRHPEGPGSTIEGRDDHPVVQVSWDDAVAYAKWAGKRLPTEAEWEFAARGGLDGRRYAWGDEFRPGGRPLANTWQGHFPERDTAEDGFPRTAPVGSFPANRYGLFDLIGNVWEWCADPYRPDAYRFPPAGEVVATPAGPGPGPRAGDQDPPRRATRGGSFLCSTNYCSNYRPSARRGTAADSGMSHLGFRCVVGGGRR